MASLIDTFGNPVQAGNRVYAQYERHIEGFDPLPVAILTTVKDVSHNSVFFAHNIEIPWSDIKRIVVKDVLEEDEN